MENEPCRRSSVYKNYFIGRASSGRDRNLWSKILTPSSLLGNRAFLETWSCSKRAPSLNIWSLNIEPTPSQISEETLESLKLRERNSRKNFERQTAPRANQATTEGHPQSDVTQRCAKFPQATQRHFNLKASIKQNLYKVAELVVSIFKVRIIEFSS